MQCELATSSINISIVSHQALCAVQERHEYEQCYCNLQTGNRFCSGNVLIWESSFLMLRLWDNLHFQRVAKEIRWCVTNSKIRIERNRCSDISDFACITSCKIPNAPMDLKRVCHCQCHTWIQASNLEGEKVKLGPKQNQIKGLHPFPVHCCCNQHKKHFCRIALTCRLYN